MSRSSDNSILLDGSSSDLARQFYYRAKANDSITVTLNAVPDTVQSRLDDMNLDWNKLPGVAQLALLWDSGFAINSNSDAVQMWTLGDNSMASLALTLDEYEAAGCEPKNCTQPDDTTAFDSYFCNGAQMNKAAKCVVQEFDDNNDYNVAMWGVGGRTESAPTIRMARHAWKDNGNGNGSGIDYVVMALHTVTVTNEPGWNVCSTNTLNDGYGSLKFPCRTTSNLTAKNKQEMKNVMGSAWVTEWLVADYTNTAAVESSGFVDPHHLRCDCSRCLDLGSVLLQEEATEGVRDVHNGGNTVRCSSS
ncbi:hypothetical protein DVH05_015435 [Phytophthora capsici]|nr:hypothetical protein DVH05_015435 [Phytophthora capsici]